MTDICFQRLDNQEYEKELEKVKEEYFKGQPDESREFDENGKPMKLSDAELEDAEDELIRIMHQRFIDGEDKSFDYTSIDAKYDDTE